MGSPMLVAAIDFGTTYSGWAYSFQHQFKTDPTQISAKVWSGGQLVSEKAPTTVLIEPDGKTFKAFGYEAENKYAELAETGEHKKWFYFRRFKMLLMDKIGLERGLSIEDATGKELYAKTVFSMAIKYLKDDLLKECATRVAGIVQPEDIMWILTVPAIWNDSAKQFMREAAVEAGLSTEKLKLALEPETASLFCRNLPMNRMLGEIDISTMKAGSTYMVIDAGGGTVDITVHQILKGGKIREVQKASGGAWGGTKVDEAYKQFIISIVGNSVFDKFVTNHMEDYLDLMREFEIKKREANPSQHSLVTVRFQNSLKDLFEKETSQVLKNAIKQTKHASHITLAGDKIRVDAEIFKNMFDGATRSIIDHVSMLFKEPNIGDVCNILMVGGFSESKILQDAIRRNFPERKIIIPLEAGLVVLKGAVIFGHDADAITERIARRTYGIEVAPYFISGEHDASKIFIDLDGKQKCNNVFFKCVEIGQPLQLHEVQTESHFPPPDSKADSFILRIFASNSVSPKYVTDQGTFKLGETSVSIDTSIPYEKRGFKISLSFGGTEIQAKAKEDNTGRETLCTVNFLE